MITSAIVCFIISLISGQVLLIYLVPSYNNIEKVKSAVRFYALTLLLFVALFFMVTGINTVIESIL